LPPYDRWEAFVDEAWRHWLRYREIARPQRVKRLGVRYVNRIDVPCSQVEIKDYLRTAIDVSPYLPQMVGNYFLQIVVPLSRFEASATVTSALASPPSEDVTSLILDIDTWREVEVDLGTGKDDETILHQLQTHSQRS
jgi:uncharacterized protein (TIGR04255 family)